MGGLLKLILEMRPEYFPTIKRDEFIKHNINIAENQLYQENFMEGIICLDMPGLFSRIMSTTNFTITSRTIIVQ